MPSRDSPQATRDISQQTEVTLDVARAASTVLVVCVLLEAAFVALDYHVNYGKLTEIGALRRMFNTAREDGLASFFGTTQTLLAGLTAWLIYLVLNRKQPGPGWKVWGWLVLALFFTYMAVDDGAQIHERLGSTYKALRGAAGDTRSAFPSYTWQFLFLPFFGALGLFTFGFLWSELPSKGLRAVLVSALGCLVLAVGMDFVEGLDSDHPWNLYTRLAERYDLEPWTEQRFGKSAYATLRHFSKSLEETLEMFANTLFWYLFLRRLGRTEALLVRFRAD